MIWFRERDWRHTRDLWAQYMHTVPFVAGRDIDLGSLVELGHIMDPV